MKKIILLIISILNSIGMLSQAKKDSAIVIDEVSVTAMLPIIKADLDKFIYNVSLDPDAKSITLLEMLRKVPMLTIEGDETIKINGNSGFKIYVNGKPNTMMSNKPSQILKGLPASFAKKIEVITNPGVKYDAEGVAGILNIVTESSMKMEGYSLSFGGGLMNNAQSESLSGIIKIGKITVSVHDGVSYSNFPKGRQETERMTKTESGMKNMLHSVSKFWTKTPVHFFDFQGSYDIDEKNLLSISAGMENFVSRDKNNIEVEYYPNGSNATYSNIRTSKTKMNGHFLGGDFQHKIGKEGGNITFSYRYSDIPSRIESSSIYTEITDHSYMEGKDINSISHLNSKEHTGQIDYTLTLKKKHTISIGSKLIHRINDSNNNEQTREPLTDFTFTDNTDANISYKHSTDIYSGYAEYKINMNKLSARTGLRFEHSSQNVSYNNNVNSDYSDFGMRFNNALPSISIGYRLGQVKMLTLAYTSRLSRPSIWNLNPYVDRTDPINIKMGNPDLKTVVSHGVNISFSSFTQKLGVNMLVGYDTSNNGIIRYSYTGEEYIDEERQVVMITSYGNILNRKNIHSSLFFRYILSRNTMFNINASSGYTDFKSYSTDQHNYGFNGSVSLFVQYSLPWRIDLSSAFTCVSRSLNLQGAVDGVRSFRLSLKRSFLKDDRLHVTIYANNIFTRDLTNCNITETNNLINKATIVRRDYRTYGISLSVRLGKLKERVKRTSKSINNDDVILDGNPRNTEFY